MRVLARAILFLVALVYAAGALVHVANMAGLSGFDWRAAPGRWQALDIVYLILDLAVVLGLARLKRFGIVAFYAAALSQAVLYTVGRDWLLGAPATLALAPEATSQLDTLVAIHVVTLVLVTGALLLLRSGSRRRHPDPEG